MAEKKKASLLKNMLSQPQRPATPAQEVVDSPPEKRASSITRGTPYRTGPEDTPIVLPGEASALSTVLQDIARRYLGARRKSGEALLEAARWLKEARDAAEHGEWLRFLDITHTTPDAAERLLNIHERAMADAQFADAVRTNWLGPSAAALLARPSTPPELVTEVLSAPEPPKVSEVEKKVRQARQPKQHYQIPQFAVFDGASNEGQQITALEMLHETVKALVHLERTVRELPANSETEQALTRAGQAIAAIERALRARG